VVDRIAPVLQFLKVPVADAVAAVPANRPENDLAGEVPPPEYAHQLPPARYLPGVPCRAQAVFATVPIFLTIFLLADNISAVCISLQAPPHTHP
jgi:hypothetical protein